MHRKISTWLGYAAFAALPAIAAPAVTFEELLEEDVWNRGPAVETWLSLLAPLGADVLGTDGDDTLAATGEGDVVSGFGGHDALSSVFDRTALLGDAGDDALTSDVDAGERGIVVQRGGDGNDAHFASLDVFGDDSLGQLLIDLGPGDDAIEAVLSAGELLFDGRTLLSSLIYGGEGEDTIDVVADAQFVDYSIAANAVDGGPGDDRITAYTVDEFYGFGTTTENLVNGGDGDDAVHATAIVWSNSPNSATNRILGGDGHDTLEAYCLTDSNDASPSGYNELWGEDGDDLLTAYHSTDGENYVTDLSTLLDGGDGDDTLIADSDVYGMSGLSLHHLMGGPGDDLLSARLEIQLYGGEFNESRNVLEGGPGHDRLDARLETPPSRPGDYWTPLGENRLDGGDDRDELNAEVGPGVYGTSLLLGGDGADRLFARNGAYNDLVGGPGSDHLEVHGEVAPPDYPFDFGEEPPDPVENRLDGGPGGDVLVAILAPGIAGTSVLHGGNGADRLTVEGGSDNLLDGGSGPDTLRGGSGDDTMIGGGGPDTFHLDVATPQGTDTLADFRIGRDRLAITGVADAGVPGLADDLDALSTFTDAGRGGDLVVDLASGSRLVFQGRGTGGTTSWSALLDKRAR